MPKNATEEKVPEEPIQVPVGFLYETIGEQQAEIRFLRARLGQAEGLAKALLAEKETADDPPASKRQRGAAQRSRGKAAAKK